MADKVAIVTDSIACLNKDVVERYGVRIIPQNIHFGGKVYRDWVDITPSEAYKLFLKHPDGFSTSAASPMDYLEVFREVSNHTRNILCVTISSKLSTIYDVALLAKEQAKAELPQTSIEVLNSQTVSAAEGFVALAAARASEEGKSFSGRNDSPPNAHGASSPWPCFRGRYVPVPTGVPPSRSLCRTTSAQCGSWSPQPLGTVTVMLSRPCR